MHIKGKGRRDWPPLFSSPSLKLAITFCGGGGGASTPVKSARKEAGWVDVWSAVGRLSDEFGAPSFLSAAI